MVLREWGVLKLKPDPIHTHGLNNYQRYRRQIHDKCCDLVLP